MKTLLAVLVMATGGHIRAAETVFLSDEGDRFAASGQDWGMLGLDVAARATDKGGEPLRIGNATFAKGLGHHANGRIEVLLDGAFETFEAVVGLQPCPGGSVVFRVSVDGEVRFDSGVMRSDDAAKPVRVSVAGAEELVLEATDAGDGIGCDMANWADARLTRAASTNARASEPAVDIAPFGRVVTWDPDRLEGTRASRIQEFPAEDLFVETDLHAGPDGYYLVPTRTNGLACIGVQWLNRRAVKELSLRFMDALKMPATNQVRVEGWFGESAWQGRWLPLAGELSTEQDRLAFRASPRSPAGGVLLTRKVRWIWPAEADSVPAARPVVTTRSRWATADLLVQFEAPEPRPVGFDERRQDLPASPLGVLDGELPGQPAIRWDASGPQSFAVRYSRPSALKSDPTLLGLSLPWDRVSVAVQDIIEREAVYLPSFGALFCRADRPITLAAYKAKIAGRKTVLEEVRELPDQTFEQAMAKTHHAVQREGPVMLSLACDNTKYVVERDGTVRFRTTPHTGADWFSDAGELRLEFAGSPAETIQRELEGRWSPIVAIRRERGGLVVNQRTFVAPCDEDGADPARLNRPGVCVVEWYISGAHRDHPGLPLRLTFSLKPGETRGVKLVPGLVPGAASFVVATDANEPLARVQRRFGGDTLPAEAGNTLVFGPGCFRGGSGAWQVFLSPRRSAGDPLPPLATPVELRTRTLNYWNAVLAPAMQIETPQPFLNDLIRSSQVRCLIAARNEADGARVAPWIAAMSYGPLESEAHAVIRGMDFLGHHEFARRSLGYFIHRYNTNGFLTTGYTTFGTAWHLWTLGEHAALTGDTNWLRQLAPELKRVGSWIIAQTQKTRPAPAAGHPVGRDSGEPLHPERFPVGRDSGEPFHPERLAGSAEPRPTGDGSAEPRPTGNGSWVARAVPETTRVAGLMPPGVLADWNAYAYHFCLNAYYAAALREIGTALAQVGDSEATRFQTEARALARATEARFRQTRAESPAVPLRDGTWVPYYPSQAHSPGQLADFFPGEDAGRSWCYDVELGAHQLVPTGVLEPFDNAVGQMLDHLEDVQFLADGWFDYAAKDNVRDWFNLGGFSKVQPYYTRNAEIYALRDDVKPFIRSYFNTLAAMVNPEVMTFWEHFHHSGAWDKTHETGYFLHQTRLMLLQERGAELWLAPMVTSNWFCQGNTLSVSNAPTRFGKVAYRLDSRVAQGRIEARIEPPTARPCARVVLRLRHPEALPIRQVTVNGTRHNDFEPRQGLIRLSPNQGPLQVVAEYLMPTDSSTINP